MIIAGLKRSFFFVLTLFIISGGALVFWLSHSPIPLNFLEKYAREEYSQYVKQLDKAELVWKEHGPALHIEGVRFEWPSGSAAFKNAYFAPAFLPLLKGKFRLSAIQLVEPDVYLNLNAGQEKAKGGFDFVDSFYFLKQATFEKARFRVRYDNFMHLMPAFDYHLSRKKKKLKGEGVFESSKKKFSDFDFNFVKNTGDISLDLEKYHLTNDANINMQNLVVSLKADLKVSNKKGSSLKIDADLENFDVGQLKNDWPKTLAPGARNWVLKHLHEGVLSKTSFEMESEGKTLDTLKTKKLEGKFLFHDLKLTYHPEFEDIAGLKGKGEITPKDITFKITDGHTENIKLTKGNVKIDWSSGKRETIDIKTNLQGPLPDALKILENKPLEYPQKVGFEPKDFKGNARIEYEMAFPLLKELYAKDMDIHAKAFLTNVDYKKKMLGGFLKADRLTLESDKNELEIKGPARLNDLAFNFTYKTLYGAPYTNSLNVSSNFGKAFDDLLTIPFTKFEGPFTLKASHKKRDNRMLWDLDANMVESTFSLPAFHYTKKPGNAFGFEGTATLNEKQSITHLRFKGSNVKDFVKGNVHFSNNDPSKLDVDIHLGENDFDLAYRRLSKAKSSVSLKGKQLDFEDFLGEMMGGEKSKEKGILDIRYHLKSLRMGKKRAFGQTKGSAYMRGTTLEKLNFETTLFDKGNMRIDITPEPKLQRRRVTMTSDNAGGTLRTLGIVPNMRKGQLRLDGFYNDRLVHQPLASSVLITDYALTEMPLMVKVLSLISFSPFEWQSKKGMSFKTLKGKLLQNKHVWTLDHMLAKGPSLSIGLDGTVNTSTKKIDLRGDIAPQNILNQGLGKIPLFGKILTGSKESGIIAARFGIKGTISDPKIWANPLSPFTPGILREIF